MLTVPTTDELATFTGRPVGSFTGFATQALLQATLMFTVLTKLTDYPDDPDMAQLAKNAIMEMADRLQLEQPFQSIAAGPFQSETIGSYSYSRITATSTKASQGLKTGLFWWDLAISELSIASQNVAEHGSIHVLPDGIHVRADGSFEVMNAAQTENAGLPSYIRIS